MNESTKYAALPSPMDQAVAGGQVGQMALF